MISVYYHRKSKMEVKEDSLTATIFDLLKYLPSDIFWSILTRSLYHQKLPKFSGEIQQISYWERWDAKDTSKTSYIEPDVFIRFEEFDLIIEAKRSDRHQQYDEQMEDQIIAYHNEFENDLKPLFYIQLGGLYDGNDVANFSHKQSEVVICKTDWTRFLDQVVVERNRLSKIDYQPVNAFIRIIDDLIKGFELHGFYKISWLKDLEVNFNPLTITNEVAIYEPNH